MNKQWIYRNGDKPFSVTEIESPLGDSILLSMSYCGGVSIHNTDGRNHLGHSIDLIPYEPYASFKIDDEVYSWDITECVKQPGHFSGLSKDGKPTTFFDGGTSFTKNKSERNEWNFCEKAAPKEDSSNV
jgi:hypothetical protein